MRLLLVERLWVCGFAVFVEESVFAVLGFLLVVWTRHGRLEAPFTEKVDIRLGARWLVVLILGDLDLLQALERRSHDEESVVWFGERVLIGVG